MLLFSRSLRNVRRLKVRFRLAISSSFPEHWTGEVEDRPKINRNWRFSGPQILTGGGVGPQISDQIYKITPTCISDLLSSKDCLSVEPSRRSFGERKKTSVEKQNTSGHYSMWAEV